MNILLVSSFLPYPLYSGGNVRLYNLIKHLAKTHSVTLICERRPNQTDDDLKEVEKICQKVITVPRKKQWSLSNMLKAGLSDNSFLLTGHTLPEMQEVIENELRRGSYDLIHVETFYVLHNVPQTDLPILLVEHNIEYHVYERYAKKSPFLLKPLLRLDVAKIKKAEEKTWKRATRVATVSPEDKNVVGRVDTEVIANGVDLDQFKVKSQELRDKNREQKILYIGDFKWIQNTDAAKFIITEVWPQIKEKTAQDIKLWIVGRNMPKSLKALGKDEKTIIFDDENSQTTPEIFSEADVLLSPKRVGGGTSYKILESLAVGTPVVTTPLGLEGLDITEGKDVLVAESPELLAEQVITVLEDNALYKKLAENGRKQIEEKYDWHSIGKKLEEVYKSLL